LRQLDREFAPHARFALGRHLAAVCLHYLLDESKAEAVTVYLRVNYFF